MATFVFHNIFHRSNHHTVHFSGFPESASDPIASEKFPFQGLFYNNCLYGNGIFYGLSNSYNWWSNFITVTSNYIDWGLFPTTYTTVNSNSANWQYNRPLYTICNSFSSNWVSYNKTYDDYRSTWGNALDGYNLYTDEVQENTLQKTFSANFIKPNDVNNIVWDLSSSQVGIYIATNTARFSGFSGLKKGGIYNLILVTDATCYSALSVNFNPDKFKLENNTNSYSVTGINIRKFQFVSDGKYLHGKSFLYDITPPDRNTYYAGAGILLYDNDIETNPITLGNADKIFASLGAGLTVVGSDPYSASLTINVDGTDYNRDFIFAFTTLSAMSAMSPYGQLGSQDRIDVFNPNLTATNATVKSNSILLNKCDTYDSIKITTRAYGYISNLTINDVETKDFIMDVNGYANHETGHVIVNQPSYDSIRTQSIFVKFGEPVPLTPTLSSGLLLWLDAMDYSTVKFDSDGTRNYVTSLSSKIFGERFNFTSTTTMSCFYDLTPKPSFDYNSDSTHYKQLILSGNDTSFVTFTVLTPSNSSRDQEWIWANANYGIFKIPNTYSLGIGTSANYYTYDYGAVNKNKPVCISTRYEKVYESPDVQEVFINEGESTSMINLTAILGLNSGPNPTAGFYTMIGGLNPLTGFSDFKLHEMLLYRGRKNNSSIDRIRDYLLDKWKFL
jgi:hypothetical protein